MASKGQAVRLFDVLALGPFLIYTGSRDYSWRGAAVVAAGLGTILYNLRNFLLTATADRVILEP